MGMQLKLLMVTIEDLVPDGHFLRKLEATLDLSFAGLGLDLMSVGGHKVGAPAGIGVLLARRGIPMTTDRPGGGHERSIRSGTPDVAGACALAVALTEVVAERSAFADRAADLRARLLSHLPDGVSATVGESASSSAIIHLSLPTARPEAVLMAFDMAGIAVAAASTTDWLLQYLDDQGVNDTNVAFYLGTHAHSDHIANADEIIYK